MSQIPRFMKVTIAILAAILVSLLLYQVPAINQRLGWRIDIATTYLRGIIYPAQPLPTAIPQTLAAESTPTPTALNAGEFPTDQPAATATPLPDPTSTPTPEPLPGNVSLAAPPYEKQDWNNCGPTTLSMYLHFYNWQGDQYTIADTMKPKRDDKNVNVDELVHFVLNQAGWLSAEYRLGGDIELVKRILAKGIPVMIEEGMKLDTSYWPNDDRWAGHYLLLTGYDDSQQVFTAQDSYYGPNKAYPYTEMDRNWKAFNRVYILVFRPEQLDTVNALLGPYADMDASRQHALDVARAETEQDPKDAFAWFNLGSNLVYFEKYTGAAKAYDTARQLGLPQRMLRYQFGPFLAYFHSGRNDDLLTLTEYALQRTPNSEEALLWRGWGLYRNGDNNGAADLFRKALAANPTDQDAKYALNYIGSAP